MENTETAKITFNLSRKHLIFASLRFFSIFLLNYLFFYKNKISVSFFALFLLGVFLAESLIFFLIFAKTFACKRPCNFPHYIIFVLEIGILASFVNYFSYNNSKNTIFIATISTIVALFYLFTFFLKQKIAK